MIFTAKSAEFLRWAEEKEKNIPQNSDGILVNIHDINNVKTSEIDKIKETIYKHNSCIYSSKIALKSNTNLLKFVELVGMKTYDCNNIESNEISTITPLQNSKINYIPYTDKRLIGILMVTMIKNQFFLGSFIVSTQQPKEARIIYLIMN